MSIKRLGAILAATAVVVAVVVAQRAAAGAAPTELVTNGGFESPAIPLHTYAVLHTPISGWTEAAPRTCGIEIQNHVAGSPFEGQQFTELDSTCSTEIYQNLTTIPGKTYRLTYEFSARPTRGPADNVLQAWWNGKLLDTEQLDGIGLTDTNWIKFSYHVKATGTTTQIAFADAGVSNSYGTYLDDVSVTMRHDDD